MRFLLLSLSLCLASCTGGTRPSDGIHIRSDDWPTAAAYGFAVSPIAANALVIDSAEAAASFTNGFYAALLVSMSGATLVSPSQTLGRLNAAGPDAHSRLRSVRAKLYQNDPIAPEVLRSLARDVQHRYLLVGWLEEGELESVQGQEISTPGGGTQNTVVHGFIYAEVDGLAAAVILDLQTSEIMWRGTATYDTGLLYGKEGENREQLDRTRAAAAMTLADYISQQ